LQILRGAGGIVGRGSSCDSRPRSGCGQTPLAFWSSVGQLSEPCLKVPRDEPETSAKQRALRHN
jgi:hypothetical protein